MPLLTLALIALALVASAWPALAGVLSLERTPVARGELWRLLTGHLVHGSAALAAADLTVLALLGAAWEARARRTCAWILLASALAGSAAVLAGGMEHYTGSSALGSGLFAATGAAWACGSRSRVRAAGLAVLLLLAVKTALELGGAAVFVPLAPGTRVAVEAHVAGALAGVLVVWLAQRGGRARETRGGRAALAEPR